MGMNDIIFCCACACESAAGALGVSFICAKEAPVIIKGNILRAFPRKGMVNGRSIKVSGLERSLIQNMKGACLISKESCKVRKSAKNTGSCNNIGKQPLMGLAPCFLNNNICSFPILCLSCLYFSLS